MLLLVVSNFLRYGSAIVILLLVVIMVLTVILQKTEEKWVYHS